MKITNDQDPGRWSSRSSISLSLSLSLSLFALLYDDALSAVISTVAGTSPRLLPDLS